MRSKSILLLALALGCGLVASIGVSQMMEARNGAASDASDKQAIFVAMIDINPNDELTAQNIKLEEYPKNLVPQGGLTKLEEVEGKRSRMKVYAGEPILASKLLGAADSLGAAKDIPAGYRVAHVKIDSVTGSSNLILPGDRVDVLLFRQPNGNNPNAQIAKIVLQDIKVFAIDTHTETEFTRSKTDQGEPITAKTISLLVTPQQALILHAASEIAGAVRLVLRNPEDEGHVSAQPATMGDIFGPDQRSDRSKEVSEDKTGDDVTNWINENDKAATPVPPTTSQAAVPITARGKMIVIYGSQLKEVDFPGNGQLPTGQPDDGGPHSSQLTGEGDAPSAPPENDMPQDLEGSPPQQ
jgi:pilus assembly protein CpaB